MPLFLQSGVLCNFFPDSVVCMNSFLSAPLLAGSMPMCSLIGGEHSSAGSLNITAAGRNARGNVWVLLARASTLCRVTKLCGQGLVFKQRICALIASLARQSMHYLEAL